MPPRVGERRIGLERQSAAGSGGPVAYGSTNVSNKRPALLADVMIFISKWHPVLEGQSV